jgi:NTE family protein
MLSGDHRTAFVLGGGGMLGSAEVGMLRALIDRSIIPDVIVGSSVGALNGAFIAADPTVATVERMADMWNGLSKREVFGGSLLSQLNTLARHGTYLHSNDGLRQLLVDGFGADLSFEDLAIPFECIAACIERASAHWFSTGPLTEAVLASCAVPGLLPAVEIEGQHYLDGGLVGSVPIGRAIELGAKRVFVLQVGRLEQPLQPPTRPWQVALVAFEIARRHHFEDELAGLPDGIELHVLPTGSSAPTISIRYRDTGRVSQRIDAAFDATADYLDKLPR